MSKYRPTYSSRARPALKGRKTGHPLYNCYRGIIKRCNNPSDSSFHNYGGRGIKNLWTSFEEFRNDMYEPYLAHIGKHGGDTTIERIDNDGNYSKENCRWATMSEQVKNRRPFQNHYMCGRRGSKHMVK